MSIGLVFVKFNMEMKASRTSLVVTLTFITTVPLLGIRDNVADIGGHTNMESAPCNDE